ncbi:MAG: hypothetical protein AAB553_08055 [Patescibacteria group bacterium]
MDQKMLKSILEEIRAIKATMLTKDDAKSFLTKEDAKSFLTKDDAENFLTKKDAKNFATKDDLKQFSTKEDLKQLRDELIERIEKMDKMQMAIFETVDAVKEDKVAVTRLEKRVDKLEKTVFA